MYIYTIYNIHIQYTYTIYDLQYTIYNIQYTIYIYNIRFTIYIYIYIYIYNIHIHIQYKYKQTQTNTNNNLTPQPQPLVLLGFDAGDALGEAEGGEGLVVIALVAGDGGDHEGLAVAAETLAEQMRELRVPVGDVQIGALGLVGGQVLDHEAQEGERLVDVTGLLQPQPN